MNFAMMKKMRKKAFLFIDGSNLYAAQYDLFGPKKYLNFSCFIQKVEDELKIKFGKMYFYASYSPKSKKPTSKQKSYLKNEALFYRNVRETRKLIFFKGYRSKTSGKEKEVDVKLAVDIVNFAHQNKYDSIYLFSGDADFMHALKIAERLSKKIYIISLIENRIPHRFSFTYQTYIFIFSKLRTALSLKQKIKTLKLDSEELICPIN